MKNINILKYTVAAGLAIASLSSCDLDLVPEDAIAYEEGKQLFLTANDVKSFENGVLSSYRSIHYGVFYYVPDLICDGFNAAVDYGNNYGSIHRCDESFTSSAYRNIYEFSIGTYFRRGCCGSWNCFKNYYCSSCFKCRLLFLDS